MAKLVRLPAHQPTQPDIAVLCAQLSRLEMAESPDEATMDAIVEAEERLLNALARARSGTLAGLAHKLAILSRRAGATEGFLSEAELGLLRSTLRDVRRLDAAAA